MDMVLNAKTLGRRPGCVVMNLGAVMFDRSGRDPGAALRPENQFYESISALNSHGLKLTSDPETLKWWKKQPSWQVVGHEFMSSTTPVAEVCQRLANFIELHRPEKIWANSPTFHVAVTNELYRRSEMPSPIHYRQEMDYRTLMDLVYVDRERRPAAEQIDGFPRQHALGDAISQARGIIQALHDVGPQCASELNAQRWVMLDIETLGRSVGDSVLSIGAARFNARGDMQMLRDGDNQFYAVIDMFDSQNCGLQSDPSTLLWWKQEPIWKEISRELNESAVTVRKACARLAAYLREQNPDKIWANSPSFDIEMLREVFRRVSIEFPVAYRQEMDFRTVMELAYPNRDDRPDGFLKPWYPKHHALGDAMEQAVGVQKALAKLGVTPEPDLQIGPGRIAPEPAHQARHPRP